MGDDPASTPTGGGLRMALDRRRPGRLLETVRGGYGALQLGAPALLSSQVLGHHADPRTRTVARILGMRQLGQALVSGGSPTYAVLALGVEVDLVHAVTMLALGIADKTRRRTALVDALDAGSFALAGALAAARARSRPARPTSLRELWAHRLAEALVPGYRTMCTGAP